MRIFFVSNAGLVFVGLAVLLLAFFALWERNRMVHTGYEIERVNREIKLLRRTHQDLSAEREALSGLGRIDWIARERLGMALPSKKDQRLLQDQDEKDLP